MAIDHRSGKVTEAKKILRQMFVSWDGFAGQGKPSEVDGSCWDRIEFFNTNGPTPAAPVTLNIIYHAEGLTDLSLAEDMLGRARFLMKIYVYDNSKDSTSEESMVAQGFLEYLKDESMKMLLNSPTAWDFGHENGSNWYQASFPLEPEVWVRFGKEPNFWQAWFLVKLHFADTYDVPGLL